MRIKINVSRAAAIKAGKDSYGPAIVEIPAAELSPAERELLAAASPGDGYDADLTPGVCLPPNDYPTYVGFHPAIDAATPETARHVMASMLAEIAGKVAKADAENRQKVAKAVAALESRKTSKCGDYVYAGRYSPRPYSWESPEVDQAYLPADRLPEYMAWKSECDAARDAAKAKAQAEMESDIAALEKTVADAAADRVKWISLHGSARLKNCLTENIECEAVYRDERLAADRPGWQWYDDVIGEYDEPRNPPEDAFAILATARQTDPSAKLVYAGDNHYAALAEFLGRKIVYGWIEPSEEESDE